MCTAAAEDGDGSGPAAGMYVCTTWSCTTWHWRDRSASSEGYGRVESVLFVCRDFWFLLSATGLERS